MAVQLGSATGTGSLKLGLRSLNFTNGRSLSTAVPLRTRLGSLNPRKLVVRAEEKTVVELGEVTGAKRGVPSSGKRVLVSSERREEDDHEERKRRWAARQAAKARKAALQLEERLSLAGRKKKYVEKDLAKLDGKMKLADAPPVKEQITDEERYMFMKLGLRMRARLLMGRRGVFDGVVENMHLHWKHRELVKVIFKGPMFEAEQTAKILEVESGGVFVGIVTTTKGQAIIFYRGKNYQRPSELRPRHLLSKRQAYERSLEMQRKRSLEQHILKLEKEIGKLQVGLYEIGEGNSDLEMEEKNLLALSEPLGTDLEDFDDEEFRSDENYNENLADDIERSGWKRDKPNPRSVVLDPIFKAQPLTIKERIRLRQEALKQSDPMHINIGKSNMVAGLAKAVRLYFQKQPFAIVGVKGRAKDTPVEEIIQQLEEATGAVLVSREPNKIILYRGWPAGEQRPDMVTENEEEEEEEIPPELRAAIMMEEVRDPMDYSYLTMEELSLIGIEYKGNGIEENYREENQSGQEDEGDAHFATWNDGRWHTEDDNGATEVDMWDEEKWYTEDDTIRELGWWTWMC